MKRFEGKLAGILGTLIFHLIAAIIFMAIQIRSVSTRIKEEFTIEFAPADENEEQIQKIRLPSSTIERILQGDEEMLNIARNLANRPEEQIDPSDYIDMVKDELIRDGKLGTDNYIDEQKKLKDSEGNENLAMEDQEESDKLNEPAESQKMAANYQGPTRIFYDLKDRNHTFLPVPVYKCQGSGRVALKIFVNQKGIVEEAQIIEAESTTSELCLLEAATASALRSRFNANINSPKIQQGTITYLFVAQ